MRDRFNRWNEETGKKALVARLGVFTLLALTLLACAPSDEELRRMVDAEVAQAVEVAVAQAVA